MSGMDQLPAPPIRWGVVNTHPHKETVAIENLQRQNFSTYCPLVRKRIKHARREQDVLRPLFPSYVFVQIDVTVHRWQTISSTFGVRALISFGGYLGFLQEEFISSLRAREVGGEIIQPESPYVLGQKVKVSGGAFDGLVATVIEMKEKDRLIVLMNLLNRPVRVKLETSQIRSI
jgi:transcription elongation factor/antiterminator RfaH